MPPCAGQVPNPLIISGPPGAGKSTVARAVAEATRCSAHLHADDFFGYLVTGYIEPWLPEAHEQNEAVMRAVFSAATSLASDGLAVVLDGVVGPWMLTTQGNLLPPEVDYVVVLPTRQIAADRIRNRTGHGFSDLEAGAHMHADFAAIRDAYPTHIVDSSGLTVHETVQAIERKRKAGDLRLATQVG